MLATAHEIYAVLNECGWANFVHMYEWPEFAKCILTSSTYVLSKSPAVKTFGATLAAFNVIAGPVISTYDTAFLVADPSSVTLSYDGVSIDTPDLPAATAGTRYEVALQATGGVEPYDWRITSGGLPDGLALDPATGVISGTAVAATEAGFEVTITDELGATAKKTYSLVVLRPAGDDILPTTLPSVTECVPFQIPLHATFGGSLIWFFGPGTSPGVVGVVGISSSGPDAVLTGVPGGLTWGIEPAFLAPGKYTLVVEASDTPYITHSATRTYTLNLLPGDPTLDSHCQPPRPEQ